MVEARQPSLWADTCAEVVSATPFSADRHVDLAVIGGGFTGTAAALEARRLGASVAVLEARTIGHGGSGRNAGLVNAGLWLPPEEVVKALGEGPGMRLLDALSAGPEAVFGLIKRHGIDCEATRNGTLHLAHSPAGLRNLQDRCRQGQQIGAPVRVLSAEETAKRTGTPVFFGALLDPRAGTIQPLSYCRGLARAAASAGAQIHDHSMVSSVTQSGGGWTIACNGYSLRAGAVLLATNAYHEGLPAPFRPQFVPVSYSQFATAPLPEALRARILAGGEGCWDTALVMSSFRIDGSGRMIVGGMGNADGPGGGVHHAWARRKLRKVYPELADIPLVHAWRGKIAMTSDHIPKVVSFGPSALAVFGYSGRGISPGTVFGTAAAAALLGGQTEALPLSVVESYKERFTLPRGAYYEAGATLTHALRPTPFF
ncbi:MAG: FAD-binding oxidoreductase [Albidovulum sp.]